MVPYSDGVEYNMTLWDRLRRYFNTPRGATIYFLLLLVAVILLTHTPLGLPFTVGWANARQLVEKERELLHQKAVARRYRTAGEFFETTEGQKFIDQVLENEYDDGEKLAVPRSAPADKHRTITGHARRWLNDREAAVADWIHEQVLIFECWVTGQVPDDVKPHRDAVSLEELALEATSKRPRR